MLQLFEISERQCAYVCVDVLCSCFVFVLFLFTFQLSRYVLFLLYWWQLSHLNKDYLLTLCRWFLNLVLLPVKNLELLGVDCAITFIF